jgi:TolB-like protein/Tfp pilus assembly protein PilF
MSIWVELKRRKVVRVIGGYALIGWLALQLTGVLATLLDLPGWIGRMVVLLVVIGFPVAIVLAWVFDITPDGIVRDRRATQRGVGVRVEHILLGVVLVLSGWLLYRLEFSGTVPKAGVATSNPGEESPQELAGDSRKKSVAILPFENLSPDPDRAYFAAGLHEEVLHQLARIHDLRVISRKSVLQYVDTSIGMPEIADELNVQFVMEGSARYSGNDVRIQAQLVDGQTDENLWVEVYQRELTDVFSIQADIAQRIATMLEANFLPENIKRIESQSSGSPQALANYFQAVSLDWGAATDKDRALALLDEAISIDPEFGSAIAFRALVKATSLNNTPGSPQDWRTQSLQIEQAARADAERALELDPGLARAYIALARIYQYSWNGSEARQAYEEGLRVAPNDVDLLRGYAWFNSIVRNHDYAIELAERAVNIDPMNAAAHAELGQRHTFAGHWDAAYTAHQAAALLAPDYGVYRLRVANNQVARGNLADALTELRAAEALTDLSAASPDLLAELAYAYSRAGCAEDAQRIVDMIKSSSSSTHVGIGARAMSLLALEQYSQALVLLREAAVEVVSRGVIDGGFKSLAQIAANVLADPELEQPAFRDARNKLTFYE